MCISVSTCVRPKPAPVPREGVAVSYHCAPTRGWGDRHPRGQGPGPHLREGEVALAVALRLRQVEDLVHVGLPQRAAEGGEEQTGHQEGAAQGGREVVPLQLRHSRPTAPARAEGKIIINKRKETSACNAEPTTTARNGRARRDWPCRAEHGRKEEAAGSAQTRKGQATASGGKTVRQGPSLCQSHCPRARSGWSPREGRVLGAGLGGFWKLFPAHSGRSPQGGGLALCVVRFRSPGTRMT